jgi:hypothetical protein
VVGEGAGGKEVFLSLQPGCMRRATAKMMERIRPMCRHRRLESERVHNE